MGATVHAIDDEMQPVTYLVSGQPLADNSADDRFRDRPAVQGILAGTTLGSDTVIFKRPVHGLDDVVALAKFPPRTLGIGGQRPSPGLDLGGEAVALKPFRPIDQEMAIGAEGIAVAGICAKVHDASLLLLGNQHPVEPGQALGVHLAHQLASHIQFGLRSKFQRHQFAGPVANAMGDVVASNVEDLAVIGKAPDDDVSMRMASVVMIDGDPVELGTEVTFHLPHEVAGEAAQVAHLDGILRRDDQAELVPVFPSARDEGASISLVLIRRIGPALLAVAGDAVAFEVTQMRVDRLGYGPAHRWPA